MIDPVVISSVLQAAAKAIPVLEEAVRQWREKLPRPPSIEKQIQELIKVYEAEQLVLVLGAGVSIEYGIPDWNTLLQSLIIDAATDGKPENLLVARLFSEVFHPSPLVAARYVRNHFRNGEGARTFEEAVRSLIYKTRGSLQRSPLMREICTMILAPARSPILNSIITYNFDDILEQELEKFSEEVGTEIPFRSIYAPSERPNPRELPIYHVHGYLPRTGALVSTNNITLGEADYHQQYSQIYSWENTIQINKFSDAHCLFIGTSFSDPNLRRLLDIAKQQHSQEGIRHYMVRKKPSVDATVTELKRKLKKSPNFIDKNDKQELTVNGVAANLVELEMKFVEADALSFGISVVWIENYDAVPRLVKQIRTRNAQSRKAGSNS